MIKIKDLINDTKKTTKDVKRIKESVNESRPPTRREMAEWINAFNNAHFTNVKNGRMRFVASKFALKGMNRELKGTGINIIDTGETDNSAGLPIYAFDLRDKNKFHWRGANESVNEDKYAVYYKKNFNDKRETLHKVVNSHSQAKRELTKLKKGKDTYDYDTFGFVPVEEWESWYGSVDESKYRGHVLADVIDDILEEEGFNSYITRVEDSQINNSLYIYMNTRDMKPAGKLMKTLKEKYGVDKVDYSKKDAAVVVPSGTLMESNYKTYFQSFSGAAEAAAELAEKEGYQIDEDDWFRQVATGGKYTRARPSKGDTHRFTVELLKRGKPAKKALHFQVYGMENGKYELNAYVN